MQQHNAALIQASNFPVRVCGCARVSLPPKLSRRRSSPLMFKSEFEFLRGKKQPQHYLSIFATVSCSTPSFSSLSDFTLGSFTPDGDILLSPFTPSTTPHIGPLLLAGGLGWSQAAPLSLLPPSQLTHCQLGCSSPCGLWHEKGRRRSTLCLPLSGNPPGAHIHNESPV